MYIYGLVSAASEEDLHPDVRLPSIHTDAWGLQWTQGHTLRNIALKKQHAFLIPPPHGFASPCGLSWGMMGEGDVQRKKTIAPSQEEESRGRSKQWRDGDKVDRTRVQEYAVS